MKKLRLLLLGLLLLMGCATAPSDPIALKDYNEANDPMEPFNRGMSSFNDVFEKYVLRPIDTGYRFIVPEFLRFMIASFFSNIEEPLNVLNDVLQANFADAGHNMARFGINTTAGILGFFDVADGWGYEYRGNDFGRTLGVWGFSEGPYVVLPFLGGTDTIGIFGTVVDFAADPIYYVPPVSKMSIGEQIAIAAGEVLAMYDTQGREYVEEERLSSVDIYSMRRNAFRQERRRAIAKAKGKNSSEQLKQYRFNVKE